MKNLTALYKEMKADPDNLEKQLTYFKALADGRLTDYYRVTDKNQALREKVIAGMTEEFDSTD